MIPMQFLVPVLDDTARRLFRLTEQIHLMTYFAESRPRR
jgi:hypothetical protein